MLEAALGAQNSIAKKGDRRQPLSCDQVNRVELPPEDHFLIARTRLNVILPTALKKPISIT